uniref:uncharacterized protein LOC117606562 n=1 Tax=Osmia lignaria TaxID=473952 RepID=UPI001479746A|nr:uncharacterized protein LOC117606562 [Osmia lignaria]
MWKHHADSHRSNAVPRAAGTRSSAPKGDNSGGAPLARGDSAEERPSIDAAPSTTQRPPPSPLEAAGTTTRGVPLAGGDSAEERPSIDAAHSTTKRPPPSPLEAAGTTTGGGALTPATKATTTNPRTALKEKPVIT